VLLQQLLASLRAVCACRACTAYAGLGPHLFLLQGPFEQPDPQQHASDMSYRAPRTAQRLTLSPSARRPHVLIAVVAEASAWLLCAGVLSRHLSERPCRPIPAGMPLLWLLQARMGLLRLTNAQLCDNVIIKSLSSRHVRCLRSPGNTGLGSSACASRHGSVSM